MQSASPRKNPLPLYALFIAESISLLGNVFFLVAIPWYVLQTTGSAAQTGITGFFAVAPTVLAGFLGGTLIDRLGWARCWTRRATRPARPCCPIWQSRRACPSNGQLP